MKDIYGNVYTTATNVTVTERKKSAGDFDWDEAVIYFAVTDRFFDGDASNNDAYGVGDYNTGEKGGSSYHGGDFAGLNQKLDYLKDLGVNTIWITPIVENITEDQHDNKTDTATYGYHGYWASDFTKLNKHLGTEQVQSITGCRSQQGNENHGGRCVKPCRLRYRKILQQYFNRCRWKQYFHDP